MVYRNFKPDGYYEGIRESERILKKAMFIGIAVLIGSIILFAIFPHMYMGFFVAIGSTFGAIYFIQNYRGWRVVQDIKRKGQIDNSDLDRLRRI